MIITAASITEISVAVIGIIGAIAGCVHGSKCKTIKCLGGECHREISKEEDSKDSKTVNKSNDEILIENKI
tara:strand:- start:24 stop:236 length:213 start_codon:yes stop_codon:yes gene_type:complete